jgi:hypothetical protein
MLSKKIVFEAQIITANGKLFSQTLGRQEAKSGGRPPYDMTMSPSISVLGAPLSTELTSSLLISGPI